MNNKEMVFISLSLPLIYIFLFILRFQSINIDVLTTLLVFLLTGLISVLYMNQIAKNMTDTEQKSMWLGFYVGLIVCVPLTLFSGLILMPQLNPFVGLIPMIAFINLFISMKRWTA